MVELRLFLVLAAMLLIPGWFALTVTGIWRQWPGLQGWLLATGIGISFYPVLFYASRFVLPWLTFGPYKMSALLLAMLVIVVWQLRRDGATVLRFHTLDWMALVALLLTIATRFWIIRDRPFPAWSDSVHHSILTQLTAVTGQLPYTLEPYFPIPLDQYHLGLYSLSATLQWIAQVPAHTALQWTAQVLNALCAVGVYLVLARKVGRTGAIVGAVTAGLLFSQPALYVNWGRFTQIASQAVLLVGWLLVWEALTAWTTARRELWREVAGYTVIAATATASVFLLHFRVAAFYLPLLAMTVLCILWQARRDHRTLGLAVWGIVAVGGLSLLLVLPSLVDALRVYVTGKLAATAAAGAPTRSALSGYFDFPLSSYPYLVGAPWWFLYATMAALGVGLVRRRRLAIFGLLWVLGLFGIGFAYLLGIRMLNVTNLGAVLIMLYLPAGLIWGVFAEEIVHLARGSAKVAYAVGAAALLAGVAMAPARASTIEAYRWFVTPADVAAMSWIQSHTEDDALFAVNTYFWTPRAPHGTDAGYWIPYFTGRPTTASVMLLSLADKGYQADVVCVAAG
ncbi:MAG: hypothetical protein R2873_20145 [Caldilineaceae bacterium]